MASPAYLWVISEPGSQCTVEEFSDWYDNEHVPLRMQNISEFLTGARYEAADSLTPGWLAAYDIEDVSLFSDPKYTKLRANRSPREGALVVRLETLDRRSCKSLEKTGEASTPQNAPKFVVTVASEELVGEVDSLKGVKGWKRSHRHHVFDSLKTGYGSKPIENGAPEYLTVHEFDDESYLESSEYKSATEGQAEVRRWKLYKATPNTAPN